MGCDADVFIRAATSLVRNAEERVVTMLSSLRGWSGFQKCYAESGGVALRQNPTTILNRLANNSTCPGLTWLENRIRSYKKQEKKSEDGVELATKSRIRCEIDFGKNGRQASYVRAPLSRNTSGWGTVEIPIIVVKNGYGPTVLFTGGVHGDEYEGQIAVSRLAHTLDPATFKAASS